MKSVLERGGNKQEDLFMDREKVEDQWTRYPEKVEELVF